MDIARTLAACSFFTQIDANSRQTLVGMAVAREFGKGEVIFRDGDAPPGVFVVESGLVRVYKLAPSGKEHVLHLAGPRMTFAEVAVLGDFPCPAYAEALEATRCVLLPTAPFRKALADDHRLCLQILSGMAMWVKSLVSLLEDIVLRDAIGRVAGYLVQARPGKGGVISLPGLKKHVASHLNLTSETLSRTLRQLRDQRLIKESEAGLVVMDADRLRGMAEGYFPRL